MTIVDTIAETGSAEETAQPQRIRPQVRTTLVAGTATQVSVQAGEHAFIIDEPTSEGGTDLGASPVEHLLAALGACQVITFQVWADKLDLKIDELDIAVAGDLDLRGFFGLDANVRPGFDSIDVQVQLSGPEPSERYEELVRTVERHCPVLDSLGNVVPIRASFTAA